MSTWKHCETCNKPFQAREPWMRECFDCWKQSRVDSGQWRGRPEKRTAPVPAAKPLPEDILRLLTYLCHPDKHGGSDAAQKATRYLLDLRDKAQ